MIRRRLPILLAASITLTASLAHSETYEFRQKVAGLVFNPVWVPFEPKYGEWGPAGASTDCSTWTPEVWTIRMGDLHSGGQLTCPALLRSQYRLQETTVG